MRRREASCWLRRGVHRLEVERLHRRLVRLDVLEQPPVLSARCAGRSQARAAAVTSSFPLIGRLRRGLRRVGWRLGVTCLSRSTLLCRYAFGRFDLADDAVDELGARAAGHALGELLVVERAERLPAAAAGEELGLERAVLPSASAACRRRSARPTSASGATMRSCSRSARVRRRRRGVRRASSSAGRAVLGQVERG